MGTALLWRWATPAVHPELLARAKVEVPAAEIFCVRVEQGRGGDRYPFSALLYQSSMFERYACIHFHRKAVPSHMSAVGSEGDDEALTRDVVLWDFRYLSQ